MVLVEASHHLPKASVLSDLKQYQYVKNPESRQQARLVYCVYTKVKTNRETD